MHTDFIHADAGSRMSKNVIVAKTKNLILLLHIYLHKQYLYWFSDRERKIQVVWKDHKQGAPCRTPRCTYSVHEYPWNTSGFVEFTFSASAFTMPCLDSGVQLSRLRLPLANASSNPKPAASSHSRRWVPHLLHHSWYASSFRILAAVVADLKYLGTTRPPQSRK